MYSLVQAPNPALQATRAHEAASVARAFTFGPLVSYFGVVLRYDNEVGKGDHRHFGKAESSYAFITPEELIADFQKDIARWNHENSNS